MLDRNDKICVSFDGRRHTMTNPEKIKEILLSEIEKMNQHREDFCRRPRIDFTRDRKIPFGTRPAAISCGCAMGKGRQMWKA